VARTLRNNPVVAWPVDGRGGHRTRDDLRQPPLRVTPPTPVRATPRRNVVPLPTAHYDAGAAIVYRRLLSVRRVPLPSVAGSQQPIEVGGGVPGVEKGLLELVG
jgi:hypothetical protein